MLKTTSLPPGPHSLLSIREIRGLQRDILGFLDGIAKTYGDIACFRVGHRLVYLVSHPDLIQDALIKLQTSLQKTWILGNVEDALGRGMLTSQGEFHKRQRRLVQPNLHTTRVHGYAKTMIHIAEQTRDGWHEGMVVDMSEAMRGVTLSVVCQTLFGTDVADEADAIGHAITRMTEIYVRVQSPMGPLLNHLPFLPRNRRFDRSRRRLDETIFRMIEDRRDGCEDREDLLSLLLTTRDEDGSPMSDSIVRDEAVAVFLAGHETTAITLTWAWYLLSQHVEVEAKFHEELDRVLGGRLPQPEDVERLTYTAKIVSETIRLYPPTYAIPRLAVQPCELGGFTIRPRAFVLVNVYNVHHDARFYDEPERFDPDRWTPEMKERLPRYAYCAFGGGPRSCLGEIFARTEAMLVLAVLGQRWKVRLAPGHVVGLNPLVNLRPRGGMPMVISPR